MAFADRIYEEYPDIKDLPHTAHCHGTKSKTALIDNRFFKMPIAAWNFEGVTFAPEAPILKHLHERGFPVPELLADHGDFFVTTVATGRHLSPTECPPPRDFWEDCSIYF